MNNYGESRWGKPPPGYIPGYGRGSSSNIPVAPIKKPDDEEDMGEFTEAKYDKWSGYESNLFANSEYDDEDRDADFQYNQVEKYIEGRRKSRTEKKLKETYTKLREERPTIRQQFSDLRNNLVKITKDEWENIPDIQDYTIKKRKQERYTPITDKIIEQGLQDNITLNAINPNKIGTKSNSGLETPMNLLNRDEVNSSSNNFSSGFVSVVDTKSNLNEFGKAKNSVLSYVFNKMSNSVSGQTSVNPIGYITDLNSLKVNSASDIADIKKARLLMKSIINTNPKNVAGWIGAARIEEMDGKLSQAREIISQAAENILDSEDIWLEAARLHPPDASKLILLKGISNIPNSKQLWLAAADTEKEKEKKAKILKKALEIIPSSEEIWQAAIGIEKEEEAKLLLYRAVECIPSALNMWLALAKLETYEKAKQILNKARKAIPHEVSIWIHAAKLEEAQNPETCDKQLDELIERSVRALAKYDVEVPTQKWIDEALNCNIGGSLKVCNSILKTAIKEDFSKDTDTVHNLNDNSVANLNKEKKAFWLDIADNANHKGCLHMNKEIYSILLKYFKNDVDIWIKLIELEKKYGTVEGQVDILKKSVESCSENELFWLMYSNFRFKNESIAAAKEVLNEALKYHPNKADIILAFVKYEKMENNFLEAQKLLKNARENYESSTNKIWIESIQLERQLGNLEKAYEICEIAMKKFYENPKFFMIGGQIKESLGDKNSASKIFEKGIEYNKKNCNLYICWAKLFYSNIGVARSIFEKALKTLPNDDRVWYEFVKFENLNFLNLERKLQEKKLKNVEEIYEDDDFELGKLKNNTTLILNKALKECPNSGLLWSLAIEIEKSNKHAKASDALKRCENSIHVKTAVGKLYAEEKHIEKARLWFDSIVKSNPSYGDAWIYYYKLEKQLGDDKKAEEILKKCSESNPKYGELWIQISKDIKNWKMKPEEILLAASDLVKFE